MKPSDGTARMRGETHVVRDFCRHTVNKRGIAREQNAAAEQLASPTRRETVTRLHEDPLKPGGLLVPLTGIVRSSAHEAE